MCASGCDYASIKAAIAAPTTMDGDTLAIVAGVYTEPSITVDKNLTLQGEDADTTIVQAATTQGTAPDRVFTIPPGVTVTLQALTIRHGRALGVSGGAGILNWGTLTLTNSTLTGNFAVSGGGGLLNWGTLTLTNSTVHGNSTGYGAGGGGLFNIGLLTVTNITVTSNSADFGGGLASEVGTMTLTNSTISGNSAEAYGGGLFNGGAATLTNSTINGNRALFGWGGGLYNTNYTGALALINSTISGNSAAAPGGALANFSVATFTNSTVTGNSAEGGGGLYNGRACCPGFGGQIELTNSIVAENPHGGDCQSVSDASITSTGYNLDSDGSCHLTTPTDRPSVDPLLGPLQDHGGPTFTQALLPGSPALDVIPWGTNGCGTTLIGDQRWQARPQPAGGACDIGAYEVGVAGQPLSAWVTGLTPRTVVCQNVTTGQAVTLSAPASPWDCEAAGLTVRSGDVVALHVRGPVKKHAADVGGAVVGMAPTSGGCTNLATGQQVTFQHLVGATAGSCVTAGLVVQPGDHVQLHVQGRAEYLGSALLDRAHRRDAGPSPAAPEARSPCARMAPEKWSSGAISPASIPTLSTGEPVNSFAVHKDHAAGEQVHSLPLQDGRNLCNERLLGSPSL